MARVTVWNEGVHEPREPEVRAVYPDGIGSVIAAAIRGAGHPVQVRGLRDAGQGVDDDTLAQTDVLIWWGHLAQEELSAERAAAVRDRVLDGMGFVVLHSGHYAPPFRLLMGTSCMLKARDEGQEERVWVVDAAHEIAAGLPESFSIPQVEMYGEPFDVPRPDALVFLSWFSTGEVIRSGCAYHRGRGRIFYFRPGHETYPIFYQPEVQQVLRNAVAWASRDRGARGAYGYADAQFPRGPRPLDAYAVFEPSDRDFSEIGSFPQVFDRPAGLITFEDEAGGDPFRATQTEVDAWGPFLMQAGAGWNDVLSIAALGAWLPRGLPGLVVSERLQSLLTEHALGPHDSVRLRVQADSGDEAPYFWFRFRPSAAVEIDWQRSRFRVRPKAGTTATERAFADMAELEAAVEGAQVEASDIWLVDAPSLDAFALPVGADRALLVLSRRLTSRIEALGCTGGALRDRPRVRTPECEP